MDSLKKSLELLREGVDGDSLNLLGDGEMNLLLGGAIQCAKDFFVDDYGQVTCACGYQQTTPPPTEGPTSIPT